MTDVLAVANVLGIGARRHGPMGITEQVEAGLPLAVLDRVTRLLAPEDASFRYRLVPKASLARRKQTKQLTAPESERLARVAKAWAVAMEVWGGEDAARDFLFRRHPMLDDERPIDVILRSELGASVVEDVLRRLQYGSAA
jgi:putative toxin-antitoxin system antitoxin component (TIGR02293 family)